MNKVLLILLIFLQLLSFSQKDSLGIYKFPNKLTFVPNYKYTSMYLKIFGKKTSILYKPESSHSIGIEGTYKWIGLGFGVGVFNDTDKQIQSKLINYDIRLDFFFRSFFATTNFQFFKGFSVNDLPDSFTTEQIEALTPNMELINVGINTIYAFNKEFSFKAIYKNDERLKYSRGSFLTGISQFYTRLSSKTSFYPDEILSTLKIKTYSSFGKFYSAFLDFGYQYAWIRKNWYIAPVAILGAGAQYQNYIYNETIYKKDVKFAYKYIINIPIGYNGDKYFYGLTFNFDNNKMQIENANMQLQLTSFKLFFGMRLL